ncbi:MAG: hydrogen peroxide-inducible genes activator [Congregibacter sp.]
MNLISPTFRQLQYFVAVATSLNFRKAAAQLRVSQPTLTHQILALESGLGLQLLERSRAGTKLTPAGRELLPDARHTLEQMAILCERATALANGPSGTFKLGVAPTIGPYLLPHVLPHIHRRHAALKLHLREQAPSYLEAGLIAGDYDLILTSLPVEGAGLTVKPLFHEELKLVVPADHRLAEEKTIHRRDLENESVLTIDEHHHFHQQIKELCERLGASMMRDYEGTSLDTLRQMVVMGMGIAFLPALYIRSEIHQPRELRVKTIHGENVFRTHALAWRNSSPRSLLFQEFAHDIQALAIDVRADDLVLATKPLGKSRTRHVHVHRP